MTTPTDRTGLGILSLAQCRALLDQQPVGRLGFEHPRGPVILPVNHTRHGNLIGFRSAAGTKLEWAVGSRRVAFEVDDFDPWTHSGWSVLAVGPARIATPVEVAHFSTSGLRPWADRVERDTWITIQVERLSGRWTGRPPTTIEPQIGATP